MTHSSSTYLIEFTNHHDLIEWVHIAEVRFSVRDRATSVISHETVTGTNKYLPIQITLVVVIAVLLLLLAACCVLLIVCVLRAVKEAKEVREGTDRAYDIMQERDVIGTRRNEAYGNADGGEERRTRESTRREVREGIGKVIHTKTNKAYSHATGGGRAFGLTGRPAGADVEYEEVC